MVSGHIPVLLEEVTDNLITDENRLFVDATIGGAGHSYHILKRYAHLRLVGIDADGDTLKLAEGRLDAFKDRVTLIRGNFRDMKSLLHERGVSSFDAILFDLGLSTYQILGKRGFSFHDDTYLDMRMDDRLPLTAFEVVNTYSYERLITVLKEYGEEEKAVKIVKTIMEARKNKPISTAKELSEIVGRAKWRTGKVHPATKTFQAVRIEVNDELGSIRDGIKDAVDMLLPGGKIGVISFHSLEDRIIKETFRNSEVLSLVTKKPLRPSRDEIRHNPSSRSAKLRVAQRV
jgi:16S rRNA (cytosine1402-N4)-methyltransferase